jgi:hypothetical protein
MKKPRFRKRFIALFLFLLFAFAAVRETVIIPSRENWDNAQRLSDALTHARSVILVEFERDIWRTRRELVFTRVAASPAQISSLRAATGAWVASVSGRAMCYEPHHRVEILQADGSELRFEMCFHCDNFSLGNNLANTLPTSWRWGLIKFFTDAGMPPRKDYSELVKNHPDYPLLLEDRRALDARWEEEARALDAATKKSLNKSPELKGK